MLLSQYFIIAEDLQASKAVIEKDMVIFAVCDKVHANAFRCIVFVKRKE